MDIFINLIVAIVVGVVNVDHFVMSQQSSVSILVMFVMMMGVSTLRINQLGIQQQWEQ